MERLGPVDVHWTKGPGDARETACRQARDRTLIIAAGGDGTVSEVARGLVEAGENTAELGILPLGTGNDFAHGVGIPSHEREAIRLLGKEALPTDLGLVTFSDQAPRMFLNSFSVGLAAAVNLRTRDARRFGRASYVVNAVRGALSHSAETFLVDFDESGARPRVLVNLSLLNSGRFGGGVPLTPGADVGDGLLDAALIGPLSLRGWLDAVRRLRSGEHFSLPQLAHDRIGSVSIRPHSGNGRTLLELDGEVAETVGTVRVRVIAGAIRVRRPTPAGPASGPYRSG